MTDRKTAGSEDKGIPKEIKRELLHYMKLTREIEDRIERKLYRQGKIVGGVYVGRGQEAICVGTGMHMRENDVVAPSHRDMGVFLMRGVSPRRIIAQYMGRKTGVTRGKDGNMHMGDLKHNIIAFVSHLGDNVPVAAGAALAFKMRGEKTSRLLLLGEGATSRGDWHEGINFAAVQKLPVVFFINNNQYAYSTPDVAADGRQERRRPRERPTASRAKWSTATTSSRCTTRPSAPSTGRDRGLAPTWSNTRPSA